MSALVCSGPECQTTVGCVCGRKPWYHGKVLKVDLKGMYLGNGLDAWDALLALSKAEIDKALDDLKRHGHYVLQVDREGKVTRIDPALVAIGPPESPYK